MLFLHLSLVGVAYSRSERCLTRPVSIIPFCFAVSCQLLHRTKHIIPREQVCGEAQSEPRWRDSGGVAHGDHCQSRVASTPGSHVGPCGRFLLVVARVWGFGSSLETGRVAEGPEGPEGPGLCLSSDVDSSSWRRRFLLLGCWQTLQKRSRRRHCRSSAFPLQLARGSLQTPDLGPQLIPLRRFVSDSRLWLPPVRLGAAACSAPLRLTGWPLCQDDQFAAACADPRFLAQQRFAEMQEEDFRLDVLPGSSCLAC
jgi:hypothetical protein